MASILVSACGLLLLAQCGCQTSSAAYLRGDRALAVRPAPNAVHPANRPASLSSRLGRKAQAKDSL
ncbi:MAG: hypothetical protein LW697_06910, partial [Blastopirellula sp.]|nr:hypothetical protein [Blastopirellula sp.]